MRYATKKHKEFIFNCILQPFPSKPHFRGSVHFKATGGGGSGVFKIEKNHVGLKSCLDQCNLT